MYSSTVTATSKVISMWVTEGRGKRLWGLEKRKPGCKPKFYHQHAVSPSHTLLSLSGDGMCQPWLDATSQHLSSSLQRKADCLPCTDEAESQRSRKSPQDPWASKATQPRPVASHSHDGLSVTIPTETNKPQDCSQAPRTLHIHPMVRA